jgi:two-component system, cell cycle response regulator DivK
MDLQPAYIHGLQPAMERPLVLAADDDEDNLLVLTHALNLFGFAHICTTKGQLVVELAQTYQPELNLVGYCAAQPRRNRRHPTP